MAATIIKNQIKCNYCGDIIESKSLHDFKWCSCGKVAVDGGHSYTKRCFTHSPKDYIEMSVVENLEINND